MSAPPPSNRAGGGIKNGDLLRLAEGEFDLFIPSDQNLRVHQDLAGRSIAILELATNDLHRILAAIQPGKFRHLKIP